MVVDVRMQIHFCDIEQPEDRRGHVKESDRSARSPPILRLRGWVSIASHGNALLNPLVVSSPTVRGWHPGRIGGWV